MTTETLLALVARLEEAPAWEGYSGPTIGMVASVAGCPNREVEAACEEARRSGAPLLTSGAGLRVARRSEELFDQYRRLRTRAVHQMANNRGVLRAARTMKAAEDARARLTLWDVAA